MKSFSPSDTVFLQGAQEFLKAGQHAEARAELEKIASEQQKHPDVLEARWEVCAQAAEWEIALELANLLCDMNPENQIGWMYRACSLDELKRAQEAFEVLLTAAERFPKAPTIPYNLACCACKLGRLKEASFWLAKAIENGGRAEIKLMALDDADLMPLLDQICAM